MDWHPWRAWAGWLSLVAVFAMAQVHRVTPAAMADPVMVDLGIGAGAFGLIAGMYYYAYAPTMIPGGALADLVGPRRVASIGSGLAAIGAGLFGAAHSVWIALLGRALIGAGLAVAFPCVMRYQHDRLPARLFGALTGMVVGVTTIASLVAYTPLAVLVQNIGWRRSQYLVAVGTLAVGLVAWALVRDSAEPAEGAERPTVRAAIRQLLAGIRKVIGNRHSWPPFLIQVGNYGGLISFAGTWAVPYLTRVHGMTLVTASLYAQIPLVGMGIGGPLTGWISDRWRSRRVPANLLSLVMVACWVPLVVMTPGRSALVPLLFVMGLAGGVIVTTISSNNEVNRPELAGAATAMVATGGVVGAAAIQPIMGWVMDSAGMDVVGFRIGFLPGLAGAVVAAIASFYLLETRGRNLFARPGSGYIGQDSEPAVIKS
jgi:MFS family permease